MSAGNSRTCTVNSRGMMASPGNGPSNTAKASQEPMTGMDCISPSAMRSPVPESRSSGSEYPANPSATASNDSSVPMTQFSSRGLRKAPVKNTRHMCTRMEQMNSSAAQWWICLITRPPRMSKEMSTVDR